MPSKQKNSFPDSLLNAYDAMIAGLEGVERKGATIPYTSLNGHMFSNLNSEGKLHLRLPKESREKFIEQYKTKLAEAYGVVLKEYVVVPDELFADARKMKKYLRESYEYVKSLKPKATKKK
jgi:TfoX/Sxy family transcriptional regulator of competence genes